MFLENFIKMCLEIYELDPAKFLSTPWLAWQSAWKNNKVKLDLLTDIDVLLVVEKWTRGGLCHSINRYTKANHKYMKDRDKNKESLYLKYWNLNKSCGWAMSQDLPVKGFTWVQDLSEFNEDFV